MVSNDHPGNVTRGVACAYFRESLPVHCISNQYLNECLIFKVSVNNKKDYVASLYRSPSQTSDEFEAFVANLGKLISDVSSDHSDFLPLVCDIGCLLNVLCPFNLRPVSMGYWHHSVCSN